MTLKLLVFILVSALEQSIHQLLGSILSRETSEGFERQRAIYRFTIEELYWIKFVAKQSIDG